MSSSSRCYCCSTFSVCYSMKTMSRALWVPVDPPVDSSAMTDGTLQSPFQAMRANRWSLFHGWLAYKEVSASHCRPFSKTKVSTERRPGTDALTYSPIYCSDVDSSRSTWHCPSSFLLLRTTSRVAGHMSRGTAVCIRTYYTACKRRQLPSIPFRHPHRCNMLK